MLEGDFFLVVYDLSEVFLCLCVDVGLYLGDDRVLNGGAEVSFTVFQGELAE